MDLDRLKRWKKLSKLTSQEIAIEADIPLSTVQKIFAGQVKNPREKTLTAIERVLDKHYPAEARLNMDSSAYSYSTGNDSYVREDSSAYQYENFDLLKAKNGDIQEREFIDYELDSMYREYTIEDYNAIPDDIRVELIDGRIYYLATPTFRHQNIIGNLFYFFKSYIDNGHEGCTVVLPPFDVRLDRDNKTMLEPDLIAFCDDNEYKDDLEPDDNYFDGVPDFVVEVISRTSYIRDASLKYHKYLNAGVKEFWLIDPFRKTVTVHDFVADSHTVYNFDDKIPVALTGGDLVIDFAKVAR